MAKLLAITLLGLVAVSSALPRNFVKVPGGGRIVGGEPALKGELPYQISLQTTGGSHFCGGSILSPTVFVTAAHCVEGDGPRDIQVVVGDLDRSDTTGSEQTISLVRIQVHERYNQDGQYSNDIALLFANADNAAVFNDDVAAVKLPEPMQQTTGEILVSGWGTLNSGDFELPDELQKVQIPTVTDADCDEAYPGSIIDSMLCAGRVEGGQDSCQGDSGGPLVAVDGGYLAGIVSWGRGCAMAGYPGVNTEVSYFIDWINEKIAENIMKAE